MAYVLLSIGAALAYLEYLGSDNVKAAGSLLYQECFGGNNPFYKLAGAMVIVGAIGLIPDMETVSMAFMVLILTVLILSHSSGFTKLVQGL